MMEGMVSSSEGTMVDTANVTFWLRTLLQQNSDLVEVVAKLEAGTRYLITYFLAALAALHLTLVTD